MHAWIVRQIAARRPATSSAEAALLAGATPRDEVLTAVDATKSVGYLHAVKQDCARRFALELSVAVLS